MLINSAHNKFLEFKLGQELYVVALSQIKEVIPMTQITPVAGPGPHVLGFINLRGQIITVKDIRQKLGITPGKESRENGIVIFHHGSTLVGMVIDSISKVVNISKEQISPVPDLGKNNDSLSGIVQQEWGLGLMLNPSFLMAA